MIKKKSNKQKLGKKIMRSYELIIIVPWSVFNASRFRFIVQKIFLKPIDILYITPIIKTQSCNLTLIMIIPAEL
jgi:hypothetical protein